MLDAGAFAKWGNTIGLSGGMLTTVGGYTFDEHWFLGGGATFYANTAGDFFGMSVPLFARGRYALLESKVTPYVSADVGFDPVNVHVDYGMSETYRPQEGDVWVYGTDGGFCVRLESGLSVLLNRHRAVGFGIGRCRQRGDFLRMERSGEGMRGVRYNRVGRLTFCAGFTFRHPKG